MAVRPMSPATVMLGGAGVFHLIASAVTFVPSFVHDRVTAHFIPVWAFLTQPVGEAVGDEVIRALAVASQITIGGSELVIGGALMGAAALPVGSERRRAWASFGLAFSMGLFGVFLAVLFAAHDPGLPNWKQYPPILAWLGATWLVVALTDTPADANAKT